MSTSKNLQEATLNKLKPLPLIAAILFSLPSPGQDTLTLKGTTEFKRLSIGVNISPDYCYRTLKNNNGSATSDLIIDLREESEGPKLGYTAGINAGYNFSKKWGVEMGIQYSNKGYAFKNSALTFGEMIDPRYGFIYTSNGAAAPTYAKFVYHHHYLDVPVRVLYRFGKKRLHFVTSVGVTTNILLNATMTSVVKYGNDDAKRQTYDQPYDFNTFNISPTISVGVDYKINNKINLRAEPTFRYGLLKITDTPVTATLWSGGLNFSCYYLLK